MGVYTWERPPAAIRHNEGCGRQRATGPSLRPLAPEGERDRVRGKRRGGEQRTVIGELFLNP
jgi:hypothetical protein